MDNDGWRDLCDYLTSFPPGRIPDCACLEALLAKCWDGIPGSGEEGMNARKLAGRLEEPEWHPPILSFTIERHGATVRGSTKASLHRWHIDIEARTAACDSDCGSRQVSPLAKPVRTKSIADELVVLILSGRDDARLKWREGRHCVEVNLSKSVVTGDRHPFKKTAEGRSRRLRKELITKMAAAGWKRVGIRGAVFERSPVSPTS